MKQILTIEESARLIESGVDAKMASKDRYDFDTNGNEYREYRFTLSDLLSILPKKIKSDSTTFRLRIGVCMDDNYWVKYVSAPWSVDSLGTYQEENELIDAIYAEIVWLKSEDNKNIVWL